MNLRVLSITVALLVALSAIVWFSRRAPAPAAADPRIGQPVLAPDLAAQAARVKLAGEGRSVELARSPAGDWTVTSYHDFPADLTKLGRLVADLGEAKIRRLVTSRADRLARLDFKDSTIALQDASGKELWQVTLGKTAEGGGRFIRYGTEDRGYLADLSLWLDTESKNWADATLLDLKAGDIAALEIGFTGDEHPAIAARRSKPDEPWTASDAPEGQRLKSDRVDAALSNLLSLRFTDTAATDDEAVAAARAHARTIKLTTFGGTTYTLTFARKPEEKRPKSPETAPAPGGSASVPGDEAAPAAETGSATAKTAEPEFETIPAGPAFVHVSSSDPSARINTLMQKRAFQIGPWTYTGLPTKPDEFWEPVPAEPPATPAEPKS